MSQWRYNELQVNDQTILKATLVSTGSSWSLSHLNSCASSSLSSVGVLPLLSHSLLRDFYFLFLWEAEGWWSIFYSCFWAEQGHQPCLWGSKSLWMPGIGGPRGRTTSCFKSEGSMGRNPCTAIILMWNCCKPEDKNFTKGLKRHDPKRRKRRMTMTEPRAGRNRGRLGREGFLTGGPDDTRVWPLVIAV